MHKKFMLSDRFGTLYLDDEEEIQKKIDANPRLKAKTMLQSKRFQDALTPNPPSWQFLDTFHTAYETAMAFKNGEISVAPEHTLKYIKEEII